MSYPRLIILEKIVNNKTNGSVLITSGPTRANIDLVRYIANTSSGALGSKIAEAFAAKGMPVVFVYGKNSIQPDITDKHLLEKIEIETVDDLIKALEKKSEDTKIISVVHAIAVLDYIPENMLKAKKKSGDDYWDIRLIRTPKVISRLRNLFPKAFITGFKLEAGIDENTLVDKAFNLFNENRLDLVIANDFNKVKPDSHEALFIGEDKQIMFRTFSKDEIAKKLAEITIGRIS